jgi:hypothetical protein
MTERETPMTDEGLMARARKASKLAAIATAGLVACFGLALGGLWVAYRLLGLVGAAVWIAAIAFVVLWFAAMADLRDQAKARATQEASHDR